MDESEADIQFAINGLAPTLITVMRNSSTHIGRAILQGIFLVATILASSSCKTTQAQRRKQFLLSHGFHLDDPKSDSYSRHYDSLSDAARDLGFSITNLVIPLNTGFAPDERVVMINNGWGFVVTADGSGSLDKATTPCDVETALVQAQEKTYLPAESTPHLRIKSVVELQQRSKPLEIKLEIVADGSTPLALSQDQFSVDIYTEQQPFDFTCKASFAKDAPGIFTILPQNPLTLTLVTSTNIAGVLGRGEHWNDRPRGSYMLRVRINGGKDRRFNYQWLGQHHSDDYNLVIE